MWRAHQFPPPSSEAPIAGLWTQLPASNRQRLIWLLSQAVSRQLLLTRSPQEKEARRERIAATAT